MTDIPHNEDPTGDQPSGEPHTCYNCFADFAWEPTLHDGEEFCCSGCVEGGPCICTYAGPPQPVESDTAPTAVVSEGELEFADDSERDSRREVLLQAIGELPDQLLKIAQLRVTTRGTLADIAIEAGLSESEAEERLEQAQAVIARTLGPEFVLEYLEEETRARRVVIEPGAEPVDTAPESPASAGAGSDLAAAIRAPLEALTAPLLGDQTSGAETAVAQGTIREALRDASDIFRLAAERLGDDANEHPLRRLLADESADEIRILVDGLAEPAHYLAALDGMPSSRWARVESKDNGRTIFAIEADSANAVVRDVMGLESPFRPTRLVVRENELQIALPPEASTGSTPAGAAAPVRTQPVFELGADAFFGARHFVTMNGIQGPPHHHSFRVEALMDARAQDSDGVVLGFGEARSFIEDIVADYNESLLNTVEPFTRMQPTSENIAKVIFDRLKEKLDSDQVRLKQVRVWESPTNSASYSDAALAI